jgi:hypothetical protein
VRLLDVAPAGRPQFAAQGVVPEQAQDGAGAAGANRR